MAPANPQLGVGPVRNRSRLYRWLHQYAAGLQEKFDDGQYQHGVIAWLLAAGPLVLMQKGGDVAGDLEVHPPS